MSPVYSVALLFSFPLFLSHTCQSTVGLAPVLEDYLFWCISLDISICFSELYAHTGSSNPSSDTNINYHLSNK